MKLTLTLVAIFCIILVGGCADIQTKGGTLNPAPPWVQEEAAAYLEAKLGKDYVDMYISFKQSFSGPIKKKYSAYFEYNFPYEGSKTFIVSLYDKDACGKEGLPPCISGGPSKPHAFTITEEEVFEIAKNQGMKKYDGVEFSYIVRVNDSLYEDYALDVYTNELKKGEISHVYIDSSTGGVLGLVVSSVDYKVGDVVSSEEDVPPPDSANYTKNV